MSTHNHNVEVSRLIVDKLWALKSPIGLNEDERDRLEDLVIKYLTYRKFESLDTILKKDRHKFSRLVDKKIISEKWNDDESNPFYSIELTDLEQQEVEDVISVESMAQGGEANWDKWTYFVSQDDYNGAIKRNVKGWLLYDANDNREEAGEFNSLESLMSYYDIKPEEITRKIPFEKGGQVKEWITANSDKVAYPKLRTPDRKIWERHSEYKSREEADAELKRLKSGFYKDAKILDFFDGTNNRIYIYVTGRDESFVDNEPVHVITVIENGKPVTLNCFSEQEKKETFEDIKKRGLKIISAKSVPFQEWKSKNKMESGGETKYKDILDMPREERLALILKSLRTDSYYSEKRGSFELIAEKANEIAEKYFSINRNNPILVKGDSVYFEPDERMIKRDGYVVAQAKYATHLVSFTPDKSIRFYDKQKVRNIDIIMEVLKNPDERFIQKNGNIVYLKKVSVDNSCCSIFRFEINVNGNLTMVGLMPEQKDKDVKKRKASGFWSDAFFGHFPPKLPSEKVTPNISGSSDNDTGAYGKDKNNPESSIDKAMGKGGRTDDLIQVIESKGDVLSSYPVDESMEVLNAGSATIYKHDGRSYEIITWNKNAIEHKVGEKTIGVGESSKMSKGGNVSIGSMTLLEDTPVNINFSKGTFSESGLSKEQIKFLKHMENLWLEDKLTHKTKLAELGKYKNSGKGEEILDALHYWESLNKPLDKQSAFHPVYLTDYLVGGGKYHLQINAGGEYNSRNVGIAPKLEVLLDKATLLYPLSPKDYFFKITQKGDLYIAYQKIIGDRMIASNVIVDYKRGGDISPKTHSDINWLITG